MRHGRKPVFRERVAFERDVARVLLDLLEVRAIAGTQVQGWGIAVRRQRKLLELPADESTKFDETRFNEKS